MTTPAPKPPFTAAAVKRGADWLRGLGADSDVVVSSRVRLARNLAGFPFLSRASRAHAPEGSVGRPSRAQRHRAVPYAGPP